MPRSTLRRFALWPALCAAVSAWALDVPLKYVKHTDEEGAAQGGGFQQLVLTTAPPGSDYKLPAVSGPRYFALASLGGEKRCFLFTAKKAGDPPYSRLFFDADGNRDLTDNPPIDESPPAEGVAFVQGGFPPIDIVIGAGAGGAPYSFVVQAFQSEPDPEDPARKDAPPFEAYLVPNCSYTGTLKLDGKEYHLTLGDGNANGLFSDKVGRTPAPGGGHDAAQADIFWLNDETEGPSWDSPFLCDMLLVGDKLFRVTPAIAAKKLALDPVTADLASVTLPAGLGRLTLRPEAAGGVSVLMHAPAAAVKLPLGTYRFMQYDLMRKDAEGDTWQLHAEATPKSPPIVVAAEGLAAAPFGEPFTAGVVVQASKQRSRRFFGLLAGAEKNIVRVNLKLEGAAKEQVNIIAHTAGSGTKFALDRTGYRPKEPQYRIATAADETLVAGSLNYG